MFVRLLIRSSQGAVVGRRACEKRKEGCASRHAYLPPALPPVSGIGASDQSTALANGNARGGIFDSRTHGGTWLAPLAHGLDAFHGLVLWRMWSGRVQRHLAKNSTFPRGYLVGTAGSRIGCSSWVGCGAHGGGRAQRHLAKALLTRDARTRHSAPRVPPRGRTALVFAHLGSLESAMA